MGGKSFYWLVGLIMCCQLTARGQLNESDTAKVQLRTGLSGSWQQGNVELLVVRGYFEFVSRAGNNFVFKSQANNLYQEFNNFKADNDIFGRNFLYWRPQNRVYPFAIAFIQTNFRRRVNLRLFGGTGVTCQVIKKQEHSLKISGTVVRETTNFSASQFVESYYNGTEAITLWRGTLYLAGSHSLGIMRLRPFYNFYWQPGFDSVSNNRIQADIGIDIPFWKGLNLRAEYLVNYEQVVALGVLQTDRLLTFGINYQMKK